MNRIVCPLHQLLQELVRFLLQYLTYIFQHRRSQLIIHFGFRGQRDQADAGIGGAGDGYGSGDKLVAFGRNSN